MMPSTASLDHERRSSAIKPPPPSHLRDQIKRGNPITSAGGRTGGRPAKFIEADGEQLINHYIRSTNLNRFRTARRGSLVDLLHHDDTGVAVVDMAEVIPIVDRIGVPASVCGANS